MGKFALLIGVSEYPEGLSALPAALNDVEAMREVLDCPEMGGFDEVIVLPNPTEGEFRRSVEALFLNRSSEDLVLLYFSGHGINGPGGKFFFSTKRTQRTTQGRLKKSTAVPATEIYDYLEECEADRKVVILDCCHSGAFGDLISRDGGEIDFQQQLGGIGRVVLTASAAMDYSFERSDEELAIYTRYLVEGIRTGAADRDEDGWVSVDELHDFVVEKLKKAAPTMTPKRYVTEDGQKIKLTKAIVADPTKQYRKLVQQYAKNDGEIRPAGRRNLKHERDRLKLSIADAESIENDVLRPYQDHQKYLKDYEDCLVEELEFKFPLDNRAEEELYDLQKRLGLTNDEVKIIKGRVEEEFAAIPPVPKPIVTSPMPDSIVQPAQVQSRPQSKSQPEPIKVETIEFLFIKGGEFMMGSAKDEKEARPREYPQHLVTVSDFYMSKYLITQAQWKTIAELKSGLKSEPSRFKGDSKRLPVENVSWHNAVEFCDRLSKHSKQQIQLPSEAQWEYACRAGTKTPFHCGKTIDSSQANYDGNYVYGDGKKGEYRGETTPVDIFKPNPFGLHDMHGNLWEWCFDPWNENYEGAHTDSSIKDVSNDTRSELRVLRGGSWFGHPRHCRSANRHYNPAHRSRGSIGFRPILIPRT